MRSFAQFLARMRAPSPRLMPVPATPAGPSRAPRIPRNNPMFNWPPRRIEPDTMYMLHMQPDPYLSQQAAHRD